MQKMVIVFVLMVVLSLVNSFAVENPIDYSILSISELTTMTIALNPEAEFELGFRYATGLGVDKNYEVAIKLYRRSAEHGVALAQYMLGSYYIDGCIVKKNYPEAVKWLRLAAEQGIMLAQYNLGVCYAKGLGVMQDNKEAVKWYSMAAEQGHPKAQLLLGNKYYDGTGVIQSDEKAYFWYLISAANGNTCEYKDSFYNRQIVEELLSKEQILRIQTEAQFWMYKHHDKFCSLDIHKE